MPLNPEQVSELTGWSKNVIYNEIRSGRLKARHKRGEMRRWWVTVDDLEEWLQKGLWEEHDNEPLYSTRQARQRQDEIYDAEAYTENTRSIQADSVRATERIWR